MNSKWILKFEGRYRVFRDGRVCSYVTERPLFLKPIKNKDGYSLFNLIDESGERKQLLGHRIVASAFVPNPKNKPQVNHLDGNRSNNKASNLQWVTRSENMEHAYRILNRTVNRGAAKLTKDDVAFIRKNPFGYSQKHLAEIMGVSKSTISYVVNRRTYT